MEELKVLNIDGVDCYEKDGTVYLKLETVARGLGFTQIAASGNEVVRWERVRKYLEELGVPTHGDGKSKPVGKEGLPEFIPENIFYRLAMKAGNETAESFQAKVADEIIPSIRRTGGYVASEDLFIATYLPYVDDSTREIFRNTLVTVRKQNEVIRKQREEIEHKEDVIIGLVDDISLAEKRQILNRVVRYNHANYQERWALLYREFENKYHIDLQYRFDRYNADNKPKCRNKLEYIDKVMNKIPELYEIAAKLFENDVKALVDEMYQIAV
ncbi:MAG: transporter [Roseburia sp.]|nr:transporter [Roseburia sp.]